jgi:3-phenylpropionate/cinnamic acid dioxygenase small subunit
MTETAHTLTDEVLDRLARLEDEREILDCLYRYSDALDGKHPEQLTECFTPDGRFAWKPTPQADFALDVAGHEQLAQWYLEHERSIPAGREHHVLTNPRIISVDRTTARAESWYLIIRDYGGRPGVRSTGRYHDELVRGSDARWRIRERLALGDMPR